MCLYPRLHRNNKYTPNKKNGGHVPTFLDERVLAVAIGCGMCKECRSQKGREWQIRLLEEVKTRTNGKFITLTFSNESIKKLEQYIRDKTEPPYKIPEGYELDNAIATTGIRLFLERWRKKYKKSVRHWLITELGHKGTENVHIHGIIWTDKTFEEIRKRWEYGYIYPRKDQEKTNYVTERTVNYIIKYVTKIDFDHRYYKPKILTSSGIGAEYVKRHNATLNKFKEADTDQTYRTTTGHKIALPKYYRNKIYTDKEREALWLHTLDKQERYVWGEKIDISKGLEEYFNTLEYYRKRNKELGYGTDKINWSRKIYEEERRKYRIEQRINNASGGVLTQDIGLLAPKARTATKPSTVTYRENHLKETYIKEQLEELKKIYPEKFGK